MLVEELGGLFHDIKAPVHSASIAVKLMLMKPKKSVPLGIPFPSNPIWSNRHSMIIGMPGSGKSYLLQYMMVKMVSDEKYTVANQVMGWKKGGIRTVFYMLDRKWEALPLPALVDASKVVLHLPEGVEVKLAGESQYEEAIKQTLENVVFHKSVSELIDNITKNKEKLNLIGDYAVFKTKEKFLMSGEDKHAKIGSLFLLEFFNSLMASTSLYKVSPATFLFDEAQVWLPSKGHNIDEKQQTVVERIMDLIVKFRSFNMSVIVTSHRATGINVGLRMNTPIMVLLAQTTATMKTDDFIRKMVTTYSNKRSYEAFLASISRKNVQSGRRGEYIEIMGPGWFALGSYSKEYVKNIPKLFTLDGKPYETEAPNVEVNIEKPLEDLYEDISLRKGSEVIVQKQEEEESEDIKNVKELMDKYGY